ncbi:MAG TPA: TlpA disulfide reductase family protein [Candidatus Acidoferrum sp.]|nr:TlpA disulfide reductase family protein [Candidatus Acidoferrum sp.]
MRLTPLLASLLVAATCTATTALALDLGAAAPAFSLPGLRPQDSKTTINLADFRGKVVYVDFWASWCGPCQVSFPLLSELRNRLVKDGKPFELIAIDVDKKPADGLDFLSEHPVQYVVVSDPAGATPAKFEVKGMPTAFLLDGNGTIRLIHQGFKSNDIKLIEAEVQKLLSEK